MDHEGHETGQARPPTPRYPVYDQDLFRSRPARTYGETLPKQTNHPQRPASWPDYAPDPPKRTSSKRRSSRSRVSKRRNPWPILIVLMLVLGAASGGAALLGLHYMQSQSAAPVQQDAKAATAVDSATSGAQPPEVALRAVARDGDLAFKVTKISTGADRTLVYLIVKNTSPKVQRLVPSIQQVRAAGRTYPANAASTAAASKRLWVPLRPGRAVAGIMVFPAGKAAMPQAVELHGSIGSTGILVSKPS